MNMPRDFVRETAEGNAGIVKLVAAVQHDGVEAIWSRDVDELIAVLRDTLELLEAVVNDLVASRAEGVVVYDPDPAFRELIDRVATEE
jgi:hypothetical protein